MLFISQLWFVWINDWNALFFFRWKNWKLNKGSRRRSIYVQFFYVPEWNWQWWSVWKLRPTLRSKERLFCREYSKAVIFRQDFQRGNTDLGEDESKWRSQNRCVGSSINILFWKNKKMNHYHLSHKITRICICT